jgi:hypothetical protein
MAQISIFFTVHALIKFNQRPEGRKPATPTGKTIFWQSGFQFPYSQIIVVKTSNQCKSETYNSGIIRNKKQVVSRHRVSFEHTIGQYQSWATRV